MEEAEALAQAELTAAEDKVLMSQITIWEEDAVPEEQGETEDQACRRVVSEQHLVEREDHERVGKKIAE